MSCQNSTSLVCAQNASGDGTSLEQRRILAYGRDAMCVENTFETGGVGAMHCHPHTQITYVVSGRFRFTIGDETREVGPGDTLLKQDGVMHGCVCLEAGILLDFFTPMREDFV